MSNFAVALGSVTQVPFAIFDEIDVFMDDGTSIHSPVLNSFRPCSHQDSCPRNSDSGCGCCVWSIAVNRKITLQALYDEAKLQAGKRQYCVLTPHDLTGIKTDDDTQILKMKEPTRLGQ